ncbi:MAG: hypothetical protein J3Q66DRAFT_337719 [Benniella sp.]|nr:MAG: hypothetical protein J3Q66DRAFT_337719 [Benniella sp.]
MSQFSESQITEFRQIFEDFDKDNDGSISRTELRPLLNLVGQKVKTENLGAYLSQFDGDKSGAIDFDEFIVLAGGLMKNRVEP